MAKPRLYCQDCGREYAPSAPPEDRSLHCAACGGMLGDEAVQAPARGDAFRRRTIGGARLKKRLAVYPMCAVYQGTHRQLQCDVRVEIFTAAFAGENPGYIERLFRQVALTREVRSSAVAAVIDLGRREDCCFIVTGRLRGSLRELLERKGRLGLGRVLAIADGVLQGLAAVNAAAVVHGNVSPDGVVMGYDGSAKLDHLGTALRLRELNRLTVTAGGTVTGRALYMAPERAVDERRADIRSDLYSLGVTMYEALSGSPPYDGRTAQEVMQRHARDPLPDLRQKCPDLPEPLWRFVARLLAKRPAGRPAGPEDALNELRECSAELRRQGKLGSAAAPRSAARRLLRELRLAGVWAAAAFLLVALAVVPPVMMYRARARRRAAPSVLEARAPRTVLIIIQDAAALPAEQVLAVRALLTLGLAYCPELAAADPFCAAGLQQAGSTAEEVREALGARYVLTAASTAGFKRRNWTLTFSSPPPDPWAVRAECAVDDEWQKGLGGMEAAVRELLGLAAARLRLESLESDLPPIGADGRAWAEIGAALQAEREGRWQEALASARRATELAPDAAPFAFLSAFYAAASDLQSGARTATGPAAPARQALRGETAALADVLDAIGRRDAPLVEQRLGDCLVEFPESVRGYFLLGLWRLHGLDRPEEAVVALKYAAGVDPGYMPAARAAVEVLARRNPGQVPGFLATYEKQAPDSAQVERLRDYAQQLLQDRGGDGPQ